jgi:hypothetical protein
VLNKLNFGFFDKIMPSCDEENEESFSTKNSNHMIEASITSISSWTILMEYDI